MLFLLQDKAAAYFYNMGVFVRGQDRAQTDRAAHGIDGLAPENEEYICGKNCLRN